MRISDWSSDVCSSDLYDSNGPDVRIRGNASQVYEKYLNLARDATTSGDRVLAESYFQHAEHYYRILAAFQESQGGENRGQPLPGGARDWDQDDDDREMSGDRSEEHTSELQSLMRISYAVFCLKKKK